MNLKVLILATVLSGGGLTAHNPPTTLAPEGASLGVLAAPQPPAHPYQPDEEQGFAMEFAPSLGSGLLQFGGLLLDLDQRLVLSGHHALACSPLEFRFLVALAQQPGLLLSYERLAEAMGIPPGEEARGQIEMAAQTLPAKLGLDPAPYVFVAMAHQIGGYCFHPAPARQDPPPAAVTAAASSSTPVAIRLKKRVTYLDSAGVSWTTSLLKPAEFTKAELKTHLRDLPAEEAEAKAKIRLALSNGTYKGGSPVTITAAKELKQADRLTIRQAAAAANAERRARRTAEVLELEQRQAFLPQGAFAAAASGVPSPQPGPGQKRKRVPASTPEPDEAEQDETMEPSDASASQAVEADSTDEPGPPRKKSKTKMYVSPANAQVWATRLEAVKRFLAENGHSVVPQHWKTADGFKLGMWVSDQRKAYRSKRMPAERILELKKLKGWLWVAPSNTVFGADDDLWNEHFKEYEAFVEVNGEARVPRNHETATGLRLGGWVCTQRERYQEKKLSPERIARLSAISSWRWVAPVQVVPRDHAKWNSQYEDLEAFVAENPDVPVPHGFITEGGFKLGQWVKNQRATHSQGKMPSERVERLEAIPGWRW